VDVETLAVALSKVGFVEIGFPVAGNSRVLLFREPYFSHKGDVSIFAEATKRVVQLETTNADRP
jgi:hypothetical protein